jgi:cell division protein FtsQ
MKIWKKILVIGLWVCAGSGLLFLLIAAGQKKDAVRCAGINILLNGAEEDYFLTLEDIQKMVVPTPPHMAKGRLVEGFPLRKIEAAIEKNIWVKDAELYFDAQQILQVRVLERVPIMRVFNQFGESFFVDSSLQALPIDNRITVKLPVFTGFPGAIYSWTKQDSLLMKEMRSIGTFISSDSFWNTQIAQIDIAANGQFNMVPTVGNHLIQFGAGNDVAKKFHKLMVFYTRVLAGAGMEKYGVLNVAFDQQIVATKRGVTSKVDSLQALKKINELIERSKQMSIDTTQSTFVDKKNGQIELQESSLRSFDLLPPAEVTMIDSARLNPISKSTNGAAKTATPIPGKSIQQNKTTTTKTN